eukprot:1245508-Amphidinium_carterae.1
MSKTLSVQSMLVAVVLVVAVAVLRLDVLAVDSKEVTLREVCDDNEVELWCVVRDVLKPVLLTGPEDDDIVDVDKEVTDEVCDMDVIVEKLVLVGVDDTDWVD